MIFKKKPLKERNIEETSLSRKKRKFFLRFFLLKRFWFVLFAFLTGFILFFFFFLSIFHSSAEGSLEYPLSQDMKEVVFNIPSARIDFMLWDKDFIKINYELTDTSLFVEQIEITEDSEEKIWRFFWKKDFSLLSNNLNLPYFQIYIPNNSHQSLSFYTIYGSLNFNFFDKKEIKGSLMAGDIALRGIGDSYGDIQVGWGSIDTYGKVESKQWQASTGFSGFIPSEGEREKLNLSVLMGSLE